MESEIWDFGVIRRGLVSTRLSGTSLGLSRNDYMVRILREPEGGTLLGWLKL